MIRTLVINGINVAIDDVLGEVRIDATHLTMDSEQAKELAKAIGKYCIDEGIINDEDV